MENRSLNFRRHGELNTKESAMEVPIFYIVFSKDRGAILVNGLCEGGEDIVDNVESMR